jgi:hypothetical protein
MDVLVIFNFAELPWVPMPRSEQQIRRNKTG